MKNWSRTEVVIAYGLTMWMVVALALAWNAR